MKLIVKHIDNLKSVDYPDREVIPQYLIYLTTKEGVKISCTIANGGTARDVYVELKKVQNMLEKPNEDFTLEVENITYEEHNEMINQI
jgi:hypothetical protein